MSGSRFVSPYFWWPYPSGEPIPGALLFFYISGSTTPTPTYSDINLSIPNTNPVVADGDGVFPSIFLSPLVPYKAVLTYPSDGINPPVQIWTADPIQAFYGSVANYAALRAYNGGASPVFVAGAVTAGDGGQGWFYVNPNDTTSTDNGGTIIVSGSTRWYRLYSGDLDITWFGADATGVADSTAAIQAAIDAGAEVATGSTIFVPPGTFKTTAPIVLPLTPLNMRLTGAGNASVLSMSGATSFDLITWQATGGGFNYAQVDHLTLQGNSLPGVGNLVSTNGLGGLFLDNLLLMNIPVGGSGIYSNGVSGVYNHDVNISDVYIDTTSGFAGINFGALSSDSSVTGLTVQGRFGMTWGIYIAPGAAHHTFSNSHVYNNISAALSLGAVSSAMWFDNCRFEFSSAGPSALLSGANKNQFTNCQFTYSDTQIILDNSSNNFFINCYCEGFGSPLATYGIQETGSSDFNIFNQTLFNSAFATAQFALVGLNSAVRIQAHDTALAGAANFTSGQTKYCGYGPMQASETLALVASPWLSEGLKLTLECAVSPGAGQSFVATARHNGSDTTLVATVSGASAFSATVIGSVVSNAGDAWSVKVVSSAGAATSDVRATLVLMH